VPLLLHGLIVAAVFGADCQCGVLPYDPVCGLGLTWDSTCDALCGGYSCYTQGVCIYNDQVCSC